MKSLMMLFVVFLLVVNTVAFQMPFSHISCRHQSHSVVRMQDPDGPTPEISPANSRRSFSSRLPKIDCEGKLMDVNSRLLRDRKIMIGNEIDDETANSVVSQLLYLSQEDPDQDITMFINSPGGVISSGLAIYDIMQYVSCDVSTVCLGVASAMGAFLLGAGTKGKRRAFPNARIMLHQPLGGIRGQAADIEIQAREISLSRSLLTSHLASFTGQNEAKIERDCDRDFYLSAKEAIEYGLIDEIMPSKTGFSWSKNE